MTLTSYISHTSDKGLLYYKTKIQSNDEMFFLERFKGLHGHEHTLTHTFSKNLI